jgi:hypothetical protein
MVRLKLTTRRRHGGESYLQQDTNRLEPDVSPEAERTRWAELQVDPEVVELPEDGVSMFMALAPDVGS